MKKMLRFLKFILTGTVCSLVFGLPSLASAQFLPQADATVTNFYAGGVSSSIGSKAVAGTGLYARSIAANTFAFTAIDAVPTTLKPVVVTSNVGVGIAQRLVVGGHSIYIPTAAGISWTGSATGFEWNSGALIPIYRAKGVDYMLTARFLKSSVSNGEGYQPIVGLLVGWGN